MANFRKDNGGLTTEYELANGPLALTFKNFVSKHALNRAGGVPQLDINGKVGLAQLPDAADLDQVRFPYLSPTGLLGKLAMLNDDGEVVPYTYETLLGRKSKGEVTIPTWVAEVPLQNAFVEFDLGCSEPYVIVGYLYDATNSSVIGEMFRIRGRKVKEPENSNVVILDWLGGGGTLGFADELQTAIDNSFGSGFFVVNTATKADFGPFDIKITFGPNGYQGLLATDYRVVLVQENGLDSSTDPLTFRSVTLGNWTGSGYSPLSTDRARIRVYNPGFGTTLYPDQYDTAAEFDYSGGGIAAIVAGLAANMANMSLPARQYEDVTSDGTPGSETNSFRIASGERDGDFSGAYTEIGLRSCNMDLTDASGVILTDAIITASLVNVVAGVTSVGFVSYTVQMGDTLADALTGLIAAFGGPDTWVYTMNGGITSVNFVPQDATRFMGDWNTVFSVDINLEGSNIYHKEQSLVLPIDGQSFSQGPIDLVFPDPVADQSSNTTFAGGIDHVDPDTITVIDEFNRIINPDNVQATATMLFTALSDGGNPLLLNGKYMRIVEGNITEVLPRVHWKTIVTDSTSQILIGADSDETIANMVAFFANPTNVWYEYIDVVSTETHYDDTYYSVLFVLKDTHIEFRGANGNFPTGTNGGQVIDSNNSAQNAGFADGVGDGALVPTTTVITAGVEVTFDTNISTTIEAIATWINNNISVGEVAVFTATLLGPDLVIERNEIGYDPDSELRFDNQGNPFVYKGRNTYALPLRPCLGVIDSVDEETLDAGVSPSPIFQSTLVTIDLDPLVETTTNVRFPNMKVYPNDGGTGVIGWEYMEGFLTFIQDSLTSPDTDDFVTERIRNAVVGKATVAANVDDSLWISRF